MRSALARRVARIETVTRRRSPLMVEIWRLSDAELEAGLAECRARIATHEERDRARSSTDGPGAAAGRRSRQRPD